MLKPVDLEASISFLMWATRWQQSLSAAKHHAADLFHMGGATFNFNDLHCTKLTLSMKSCGNSSMQFTTIYYLIDKCLLVTYQGYLKWPIEPLKTEILSVSELVSFLKSDNKMIIP